MSKIETKEMTWRGRAWAWVNGGTAGLIWYDVRMLYLTIKALISGAIVATVSEIAKRYPGFGGLVAALPLISLLGMVWLWRDTHDAANMATHSEGTFWFVLPSLPMFLLIPALLRRGPPSGERWALVAA